MCNGDEVDQLRSDVRYLMDRAQSSTGSPDTAVGTTGTDADLLTKAYHPDGVDEHGNAVNSGPTYAAWINPVHAAGSQVHTHNITTHVCEIDGDKAHCESYVLVCLSQPQWRHRSRDQRPLRRPIRAT